jgi:hypothetical protein
MLTALPICSNQLTKTEGSGYTKAQLSGVIATLIAGGAKENRDFVVMDDLDHPGKSVIYINYEAHQPSENMSNYTGKLSPMFNNFRRK